MSVHVRLVEVVPHLNLYNACIDKKNMRKRSNHFVYVH